MSDICHTLMTRLASRKWDDKRPLTVSREEGYALAKVVARTNASPMVEVENVERIVQAITDGEAMFHGVKLEWEE